jgi:glycerol uptake facilitator-like aquaporin
MTPPARVLAAEAVGTALLVATVVGSGIMASRLTADTGLMLLANAAATAAALYVLIALLGPISGAQFNPVVTLCLRRETGMTLPFAAGVIAAQLAGGICGTWLAHAMHDRTVLQVATTIRSGPGQWLAEGVATATLVGAIILARAAGRDAAAIVALWIGAAYWFTASTSFANPAVTLARTLTDSFAGIRPWDAPAFLAAQAIGAILGASAARALVGETAR